MRVCSLFRQHHNTPFMILKERPVSKDLTASCVMRYTLKGLSRENVLPHAIGSSFFSKRSSRANQGNSAPNWGPPWEPGPGDLDGKNWLASELTPLALGPTTTAPRSPCLTHGVGVVLGSAPALFAHLIGQTHTDPLQSHIRIKAMAANQAASPQLDSPAPGPKLRPQKNIGTRPCPKGGSRRLSYRGSPSPAVTGR